MSRQPEKTAKESKAFCEGAAHEAGGGLVGDNPFTVTDPVLGAAWQDGFLASETPSAWLTATAYVPGQIVTADTDGLYACVVAGTSTAEPTGDQHRIVDTGGAPVWQFQGRGTTIGLGCCGRLPAATDASYVPTWQESL